MKYGLLVIAVCALVLVVSLCPAYSWEIAIGHGEVGGGTCRLGADDSLTEDIYVPLLVYPEETGVFQMEYMQHSADFQGDTGLYSAAYKTPIPPGASKKWSNILMWAQNYTPVNPYQIPFLIGTWDSDGRPIGYTGHLVLDYVPLSANWTGPMDYWLDLGVDNTLTLPIATTSDPLQGIRMSLTVYAPDVPEPSSLLLLGSGLLFVVARRRRS